MIKVGDVYAIERRLLADSAIDHSWEATVVRITPKRAYFDDESWFALDDPTREVRPCNYQTTATPKRSTP